MAEPEKEFLRRVAFMRELVKPYKSEPYPGGVVLFRAMATRDPSDFGANGWNEVLAEGVQLEDCQSTHMGLFEEPFVVELAARLAERLSKVDARLRTTGKVDRKARPKPDFEAVADECRFVAASTPTEIVLARIWCEVLGLKHVGVHDNFFELGGHSVLAVRIFSEIEKMFGDRPPLATLFRAPTIERLAICLEDRSWKRSLSPLVAIQPRGSLPPFFGVHGGYGDVMFYSELTRCLGKNQPFYGLQAKGLEGCETRYTSIEAIASYYLQEIRQVQARGPYFLGGYCTGGVIAFEMAQQLRAAGEEVAFLVLFDTNNPERPARHSTIRKRIGLALDEASGLPPSEKPRYFARRVAYRLKWEAGKVQKAGYNLLELLYKTRKSDGEKTDGGLLPLKLPVWITLEV